MLAGTFKKSFDKYFNATIEAWTAFAASCFPVYFNKDEILKRQDTKKKFFITY